MSRPMGPSPCCRGGWSLMCRIIGRTKACTNQTKSERNPSEVEVLMTHQSLSRASLSNTDTIPAGQHLKSRALSCHCSRMRKKLAHLPDMIIGMACAWIGSGRSKALFFIKSRSFPLRPAWVHARMGLGIFFPRTCI